jgi:putative redox protein
LPTRERITFANKDRVQLAAILELPDTKISYYALFSHCFTCGKDILAATRIANTLALNGVAVLRFDFTGLGDSHGEFSNTNFSGNVADLLSAADFLRKNYQAPQLVVGHSLGGTAALHAVGDIFECKAVVTIGSPANADHLLHLFKQHVVNIEKNGAALVNIAGRDFDVQKQFIEDLKLHNTENKVSKLRKALLVFHSPVDEIVSIDQAGIIFTKAKHPKSFITLDKANHLLTSNSDASYVANTIVAWAQRYIDCHQNESEGLSKGQVQVLESNHKFLREVMTDDHQWFADEPTAFGGSNRGPDPYEHLLAAVGACTSMTIRMYANRKKWPLDDVVITLEHTRKHIKDCQDCDKQSGKMELIIRTINLVGELDESQRKRLLEIADKCPVHKTIVGDLKIKTINLDG